MGEALSFGFSSYPRWGEIFAAKIQGHSRASEQINFADGKRVWDIGLTHLSRACVWAVPEGGVLVLAVLTRAGSSLWGPSLAPAHSKSGATPVVTTTDVPDKA